MKVSKSRWSKSTKITVVDADVRMDIFDVSTNDKAYDTNLWLSDKEIQAKVAKST